MLVSVPLALGRTDSTGLDASLDLGPEHLDVLAAAPNRQPSRGRADLGAIEAGPDTAPHVHLLGDGRVRAGCAEQGAKHRVPSRRDKRLIDVAPHIGMCADHLQQGHGPSRFVALSDINPVVRLAFPITAVPMSMALQTVLKGGGGGRLDLARNRTSKGVA